MVEQIISLLGAAMILVAYAALQLKWLARDSISYLLLNLIGSTILMFLAARMPAAGVGLVVVEGAWAIISLMALLHRLMRGGATEEVVH